MSARLEHDADNQHDAIAQEQKAVDAAYARRDELLTQANQQLADIRADDEVGVARLASVRRWRAELEHAERGLVFGRLDSLDGSTRRLGRIGLPDPVEDNEPLVLDWRARAARAFYTATPLDPQGYARRRHIRLDGRDVIRVDDEPLDPSLPGTDLVGEGALLAALSARRTGTMGTAIATLQREQDDIVRAPANQPLVVQGGPGTGKTVVALHRVAYLLFDQPELARQGVLVIGPSRRFLDYIAQVLPALGETSVVAMTLDTLIPGVETRLPETREVAEIKGRDAWQPALTAYVRSLRPQPAPLTVAIDGEQVTVDGDRVQRAIDASAGRDYHAARRRFIDTMHDALTDGVIALHDQLVASMEEGFEDILAGVDAGLARADNRGVLLGVSGGEVDGSLTDADIERLRTRIADDTVVAGALEKFWPTLDAETTLSRLLGDCGLLTHFMPWLTDGERNQVLRAPDLDTKGQVAPSDLPLLDAIADALGEAHGSNDAQGEFVAHRAADRRDWVYGHVVIDEAQELSAMQWHMVGRRVPSRSVTAVGDIDQAETPHRHTTWEQAVSVAFGDRWRRADLTICYRTPREVMALTPPVLKAAGSHNHPPRAMRDSGYQPWEVSATEEVLIATTARLAAELTERWAGGTVGVIAPSDRLTALRSELPALPVLAATEAKGLEWDATLVVDPGGICREPRGWNGLYVALTRCTQELGQVLLAP